MNIKSKKSEFYSSKVYKYSESIVVIFLFFLCTKYLVDYGDLDYQTWKDIAGAKAVLAFTFIIFILRKVRLINWQSLVATVFFIPVAIGSAFYWINAHDILKAVLVRNVAEWLALMIVVDLFLYGDISSIIRKNNILFFLYAIMAFGMIFRRNGISEPYLLAFPMLLFALVKIDRDKQIWLFKRFIDSWFISFLYICIKSFIVNPFEWGRYYGSFVTLGFFGVFISCSFVVALVAVIFSKKEYGVKSFCFWASVIWLAMTIFMLLAADTTNSFVGVGVCMVFIYLFVRKDNTKKALRKRYIKLGIFTIAFIGIACGMLSLFRIIPYKWLQEHSTGALLQISRAITVPKYAVDVMIDAPWGEKLFTFLDVITSYRMEFYKTFIKGLNFQGNGTLGYYIEKYDVWALHAHSTYLQFASSYGILTGIEVVLVLIASVVRTVKRYIKSNQSLIYLLPLLWLANMIGVWMGETMWFFFPVSFYGLMFIAMLLPMEEESIKSTVREE